MEVEFLEDVEKFDTTGIGGPYIHGVKKEVTVIDDKSAVRLQEKGLVKITSKEQPSAIEQRETKIVTPLITKDLGAKPADEELDRKTELSAMKVPEIKAIAEALGLSTDAKKAPLIESILAAEAAK